MRISELAEATGVALPTLKYYLREGLLMPGESTSRTRAEYAEAHVERVRLVRALVESGGLGIAAVRSVLAALDGPPALSHELLGTAHAALPPPVEPVPAEATEEVRAWLEELGWEVWLDGPLVGSLARAVADARAAGVELPPADLTAYAEAARAVAEVDLAATGRTATPADAMHLVVVGTVMVDPVLITLRRLAQEVVSREALGM